jgi:hypothetical protein
MTLLIKDSQSKEHLKAQPTLVGETHRMIDRGMHVWEILIYGY